MTTTLWDFPAQQYGDETQGSTEYKGATPAWVIWNLLQRYTRPGDLVLDPMAGSGTTLDVAKELGRKAIGYDLNVTRPDVTLNDARSLPLGDATVNFVFIDPPYSTHIEYNEDSRNIGNLHAAQAPYMESMAQVIAEIARVLKPGGHLGLYVCDSLEKGQPLMPISFDLFAILRRHFEPVDIVAVVRRNKTLLKAQYHEAALAGGYFLRGFNHLFIMKRGTGMDDQSVRESQSNVQVMTARPHDRTTARQPDRRRRAGWQRKR